MKIFSFYNSRSCSTWGIAGTNLARSIIFVSCCVFPNHLIMSVCNWVEQFAWSRSSAEILLKYVPENDNQSSKVDSFWYLLTNHDELEQLNLVNYSWMVFLLRLCWKECQSKIDRSPRIGWVSQLSLESCQLWSILRWREFN